MKTMWIVHHSQGFIKIAAEKVERILVGGKLAPYTILVDDAEVLLDTEVLHVFQPHSKSETLKRFAEGRGWEVIDVPLNKSPEWDYQELYPETVEPWDLSILKVTVGEWMSYMDKNYGDNEFWFRIKECLKGIAESDLVETLAFTPRYLERLVNVGNKTPYFIEEITRTIRENITHNKGVHHGC